MDIDAKTLAEMKRHFGCDPFERRNVSVEVFSEYASSEWALTDFLEQMKATASDIPEELMDSATVELEVGYDESSRLVISYVRPMTDEEVNKQVASALAYVRRNEANERATYERLREKFA